MDMTKSVPEIIDRLKTEIRTLYRKIDYQEEELKKYQDDFKILTDAEETIAQLNAITENNDYIGKVFGNGIDDINELGTSDTIPGFDKLFGDFSKKVSTQSGMIWRTNSNYKTSLLNTAKEIDAAQKKVGKEIERISKLISGYQLELGNKKTILESYTG